MFTSLPALPLLFLAPDPALPFPALTLALPALPLPALLLALPFPALLALTLPPALPLTLLPLPALPLPPLQSFPYQAECSRQNESSVWSWRSLVPLWFRYRPSRAGKRKGYGSQSGEEDGNHDLLGETNDCHHGWVGRR